MALVGLAFVAVIFGICVWSSTGEEENLSAPLFIDSDSEESIQDSEDEREPADVDELIAQTARRFQKPVREGRVDLVVKLLQALKQSPQTLPKIMNWQDPLGATVLHWCAFYGSEEHALLAKTFLLLPGTDGALLDKHNNSACHTACMRGHADVLAHLAARSNGCDPLELNSAGLSCLHYAAQRGDARTLAALRLDAMDVDAYSGGTERATALYLAVSTGSAGAVRELLKAGASASKGRLGAGGTEETALERAGRELEAYEDIVQQLGSSEAALRKQRETGGEEL